MKRFLAALLLIPALALGAGNDLLINQRNPGDTATLTRAVVPPSGGGVDGIMGYAGGSNLPVFYRLGAGIALSSGAVIALPQAWTDITGKPTFATVATTGAYADLTGKPALFSGAYADLTGKPTLFSGNYADLAGIPATFPPAAHTQTWSTITATPTTLAGYGITDAYPLAGNPSGFLTGITSGQVTAALGFTPYNATNPSAFISQAGARSAISLTTTGTAGAATYNSSTGVLNIPNYAPGTGTVTSVTAGTGLSGGTITTSGTISLPNTGTAGSYANVTTDAQGRVTAGTNRSQAAATRSLNTAFQISTNRDAWVSYSVQITVTASIAGGQNGDVILEIASDSGFTANVQTLAISGLGQTYTLAVAIQGVQPQTGVVTGYVPAGYYTRLRTVNNTGTPGFSYRAGQEVLQ